MILLLIKVRLSFSHSAGQFKKVADSFMSTLGINLDVTPMSEVYYKFGLEAGTQDFIGHAMALHLDDSLVCSSQSSFVLVKLTWVNF